MSEVNNHIKVFENLISKDKFMELHMKSNLKPIMVNMSDVKAVRAVEDGCILFLGNGYEDCTVREDYYDVKALLFSAGPTVIKLELDEEGRKVAEKWIEKLQSYPVVPFTTTVGKIDGVEV